MEETKQPETEMEYWQCIESVGGFQWRLNHDLADGRIEDPDGSIAKEITRLGEVLIQLVKDVTEKFGVIPLDQTPKTDPGKEPPPAPEGKTYYWDWYEKCKLEFYQGLYDKIICSACPLSKGLNYFIQLNQIPCEVFHGALYHLRANHICGMLNYGEWTTQHLHSAIYNKAGRDALATYKAKVVALKASPQPKV
jgi:hypothetical protein